MAEDFPWDERAFLWRRQKQERIPATASLQDLPKTIMRKCCPGKTCFNVDLHLKASETRNFLTGEEVLHLEYNRGSNGDSYFTGDSVEELIAFLNDSTYWPDLWGEWAFKEEALTVEEFKAHWEPLILPEEA